MSKVTLIKPRMSEKTYILGKTKNVYTFDVPGDANKHSVAEAVEAQFEVKVAEVNITNLKGKKTRLVRKNGKAIAGQRSDVKKAYVTLVEGQHLPFFDEPEEDKKADKKASKAEKETK
ncbi:MAG TPA: 50S ribosomal protein L23 [Patescibacteria group bacterium]|nr:50S ribosomal protein L23 [Patescibacteria group bacterium]